MDGNPFFYIENKIVFLFYQRWSTKLDLTKNVLIENKFQI